MSYSRSRTTWFAGLHPQQPGFAARVRCGSPLAEE